MNKFRACRRCKSPVKKSDNLEYSYQCLHCDEDLYKFETEEIERIQAVDPVEKHGSQQRYRVPLLWQQCGHVYVTASSEAEAVETALGLDCQLPHGEYIDDSVMIDPDVEIEIV